MGPTVLNNPQDLPSNFDIRRYDACTELSGLGWYSNLMQRYMWRLLGPVSRPDLEWSPDSRKIAETLFDNPVLPPRALDQFPSGKGENNVTDLSALDLLGARPALDFKSDAAKRYRGALSSWEIGMDSAEPGRDYYEALEILSTPARQMFDEIGVSLGSEAYVCVDLHASEDKLTSDFLAWVRKTKAALNIPPLKHSFTSADYAKWHVHRVLAFIDLNNWAELNHIRLTNQLLGVALFPDEFHVGLSDRIRKVVGPLSQSLLSTSVLEALRAQVATERTE